MIEQIRKQLTVGKIRIVLKSGYFFDYEFDEEEDTLSSVIENNEEIIVMGSKEYGYISVKSSEISAVINFYQLHNEWG